MRADRLVAILLLLQQRERVTAAEVAEELEISERTARRDLDEAMRIARRGEMRLHQCDAHLELTRLAPAEDDRDQARHHLAEARRLVEQTGYHRRDGDLAKLQDQLAELE